MHGLYFVKKNYKDLFPDICDRSRFNRTKRNLYKIILEIQKHFSNLPIFRHITLELLIVCPFQYVSLEELTLANYSKI